MNPPSSALAALDEELGGYCGPEALEQRLAAYFAHRGPGELTLMELALALEVAPRQLRAHLRRSEWAKDRWPTDY